MHQLRDGGGRRAHHFVLFREGEEGNEQGPEAQEEQLEEEEAYGLLRPWYGIRLALLQPEEASKHPCVITRTIVTPP